MKHELARSTKNLSTKNLSAKNLGSKEHGGKAPLRHDVLRVAKVLFSSLLSLLLFLSPAVSESYFQYPVINEIMYNPPTAMGSDNDYEWIEIYNPSGALVVLDGWTLSVGNTLTFLSGTIPAGGYAVIAKELFDSNDADADCFMCYYHAIPENVLLLEGNWNYLSNSGGTITLCSPDFSYCDEATYTKSMGANGDGSSLERVSASSKEWSPSTDSDALYASGKPDGTPGERNSVASSPSVPGVPEFSTHAMLLAPLFSVLLAVLKRRAKTATFKY
ncbi:lamin tail domain-containing protein [Candidatus Woesearchaeota archaeon]|nr:MAG: lamin tail domain-containing protein [Candidatus Woesearchaeota archaeon]